MDLLLKPPVADYPKLLEECADGYAYITTRERKQRILASKTRLQEEAKRYEALAKLGCLDQIDSHGECGEATTKDMIDLYDSKFVPNGQPGRKTYSAIMKLAVLGRCPLCSKLPADTVDHYLPKSKFPAFSIYPSNLVPACSRCNTSKLAKSDELILHPYFDDVSELEWLKCALIDADPVSVRFEASDEIEPTGLQQRIVNHISHTRIDELYAISALSHLSSVKMRLEKLGQGGGPDAVRDYVIEELASRRQASSNSWDTALYVSLVSTDWFLDGGYYRIDS